MSTQAVTFDILLFTEKQAFAKQIAGPVAKHWPGKKIGFIVCRSIAGLFKLKNPDNRDQTIAFSEPQLQPWEYWPQVYSLEGEHDLKMVGEGLPPVERALRAAGEIVYACDPDYSGAYGFQSSLSRILGEESLNAKRKALWPTALDQASIVHGLQAQDMTTHSHAFLDAVRHGQAKRWFDWNYSQLALAAFTPALLGVGVPAEKAWVSKYALQILFRLKRSGAKEAHNLYRDRATASNPEVRWGSPISRLDISNQLLAAGLVEEVGNKLKISERGLAFLARVHPGCEDPRLPLRLREGMENWPASKPALESYLTEFFTLQFEMNKGLQA
ncbi:hypothetical protein HNP46_000034 [Pseudomonas nitritireducens]|uniref:Uncharacterized protein n=1 Tax=Pseudomonas nitroreducens TaxID=46680 RepID=A0A7W7KFE1_PSENT|nr:hypothetical protein [Pseudomonas nitritireducens]MBB4861223.1 hypothetical protein [Pseudomonas nitritireducens]